MIGILVTFFVLGLAIFVHELGHFLVMRRNGIKVLEFAVGFGPRLAAWQGQDGTVYALRAIPLGGFVQPEAKGPQSMEEARPWVKFKVALAGPMMNCVLAFAVLTGMLYTEADASPLLEHSLVVWLPTFLRPIVVALFASFALAIVTPAIFGYMVVTNFMSLMSGMAGPIGIFQMGSSMGGAEPTATSVLMGGLYFMWLINVGIAGFNLMPLHPLDGGHCVKAILAKIPGLNRPVVFKWFNYVTAGLVIALIVVVCAADILRLAGFNFGS